MYLVSYSVDLSAIVLLKDGLPWFWITSLADIENPEIEMKIIRRHIYVLITRVC